MCRFFNVRRSGYYDLVARMHIPDTDLSLAEKIEECQKDVVRPMDIAGRIYGLREKVFITILRPFLG